MNFIYIFIGIITIYFMVRYQSVIEPHANLRWEEYGEQYPLFIRLAFRDARETGVCAIIEQPNTSPALVNREGIERRKLFADKFKEDIYHGMYVAFTSDAAQQQEAINLVKEGDRVHGDKIFYVRSTASGLIEIVDPEQQRDAWFAKAKRGYKGPSIGHFEDGKMFVMPYDSAKPETHSLRQCPEAEPVQFEAQFKNAYDAGYEGDFVVLHTSNPNTIDLGEDLVRKLQPKFRVFYETTWHHMFLNADDDYPIHGNGVKMNPPLRSRVRQERLLRYVLEGRTHLIGGDHAPHPVKLKGLPGTEIMGEPRSGIVTIPFIPKGIELLQKQGLDR